MKMINQKNKPESQLLYELMYISLDYPAHKRKVLIKKWLSEGYDPNLDWDKIEQDAKYSYDSCIKYQNRKNRDDYPDKDENGFYHVNCIICGDEVLRVVIRNNVKCNKNTCRNTNNIKKSDIKKEIKPKEFECKCSTCDTVLIRKRKLKKYTCDKCINKIKSEKTLERYYSINNKTKIDYIEFYNESLKKFECPCRSCSDILLRKQFIKNAICKKCLKLEKNEYSSNYLLSDIQREKKKLYQAEYRLKHKRTDKHKLVKDMTEEQIRNKSLINKKYRENKNANNNTNIDNSLHS